MKPIQDQIVLITGSTDGLGKAAAMKLASRGAVVLVHGRDRKRVDETVREVRRAGGQARGYVADFSELAQVRRLAGEVARENGRLDLLVNNAGIGGGSPSNAGRQTTPDGLELRFAVNYLSGFLLTRLVLPLLRAGAPSRVVNVSSVGQRAIDFDDVMLERAYEPMRAYRQSKLAQILFTIDLAEELGSEGITVNALHPASLMNTKMVMEWFGRASSTVEEGLDALLYVAESPEIDGVSGAYFDQKRRSRADAQAYDPAARARLKALSERLVGL